MREYIYKGAAIFAVSALPLTLDAETTQRAIQAVRAVPAADVVEVVHGEWWSTPIENKEAGHKVKWDYRYPDCPAESCYCSICGDWLTASDEYPVIGKFCPNCGADMR